VEHETLAPIAAVCRELPECVIDADQHHKLSVRGRTLGWHLVDHHGDGRVALTIRAAPGENEALVASDGQRFFMPPYVARHGYVGVYLDVDEVAWDEVCELITDAYRMVAPKKLVAQLE
jgi:hypothetical protein